MVIISYIVCDLDLEDGPGLLYGDLGGERYYVMGKYRAMEANADSR